MLIWAHGLAADVNPMRELYESLTAIGKRNVAGNNNWTKINKLCRNMRSLHISGSHSVKLIASLLIRTSLFQTCYVEKSIKKTRNVGKADDRAAGIVT